MIARNGFSQYYFSLNGGETFQTKEAPCHEFDGVDGCLVLIFEGEEGKKKWSLTHRATGRRIVDFDGLSPKEIKLRAVGFWAALNEYQREIWQGGSATAIVSVIGPKELAILNDPLTGVW